MGLENGRDGRVPAQFEMSLLQHILHMYLYCLVILLSSSYRVYSQVHSMIVVGERSLGEVATFLYTRHSSSNMEPSIEGHDGATVSATTPA